MTDKRLQELIELAKQDDARQDAKRKSKTFAQHKHERNVAEYNAMVSYSEKPIEVGEVVKEKKEWDVSKEDLITYFDPTLSYELTGYRPITKTEGLDFDPTLFTVAADNYRRNGRYTSLLPGTFAHRNYWEEEFRRCQSGVTIGRYRLTGENYFFLNYYRLLSVLGNGAGGEIRSEDFPGFFAKQYEYFHYLELVRVLGKDGIAFKSRGVN